MRSTAAAGPRPSYVGSLPDQREITLSLQVDLQLPLLVVDAVQRSQSWLVAQSTQVVPARTEGDRPRLDSRRPEPRPGRLGPDKPPVATERGPSCAERLRL